MYSLLFVALVLTFLIVSAVLTLSFLIVKTVFRSLQTLLSDMSRQNQKLTNLCAAKDLESFRHLSAIQTETEQTVSAFKEANSVPMDDQSVAMRLAETYRQQGQDPRQAMDDPLDDFGGIGVFLP